MTEKTTAKNGFLLYLDQQEFFEDLPPESAKSLILAIFEHERTGTTPDLDPVTKMAFRAIRQTLDRNRLKHERICEMRREAGAKGGLAKASKTSKSYQKQANASKSSDTDTDTESDTEDNTPKPPKGGRKRFTPPELQEVQQYCKERQNNVNPESFVDFYSSKGWMVGKNKMKDWKAAVRTWEKHSNGNQKPNFPAGYGSNYQEPGENPLEKKWREAQERMNNGNT